MSKKETYIDAATGKECQIIPPEQQLNFIKAKYGTLVDVPLKDHNIWTLEDEMRADYLRDIDGEFTYD